MRRWLGMSEVASSSSSSSSASSFKTSSPEPNGTDDAPATTGNQSDAASLGADGTLMATEEQGIADKLSASVQNGILELIGAGSGAVAPRAANDEAAAAVSNDPKWSR